MRVRPEGKNPWILGACLGLLILWGGWELKQRVYVRGIIEQIQELVFERPLSVARLGDGGPAQRMILMDPMGLALAPDGDIYISDRGRGTRGRMIWRIDSEGRAHAVAGTGKQGRPVAGKPALRSPLRSPEGIAFDPEGRLHFADGQAHQVFRVEPNGRLTPVAGTGRRGFSGDGGPAREAQLWNPAEIDFDPEGNLYVADVYNHRVRRVRPDGTIETVAGGPVAGYSGENGPARDALLREPWGIFFHPVTGDLWIGDSGNNVIRTLDAAGVLRTIAGTGRAGYSGDEGPVGGARLDSPQSFAMECSGNVLVGDEHNHAVRRIRSDGTIETVLGDGTPGFSPDGVPAPARLNDPENVLALCDGSIYVTDGDNGRVLRLDPAGRIWNYAGRGPSAR